jgi:hypothetical protein
VKHSHNLSCTPNTSQGGIFSSTYSQDTLKYEIADSPIPRLRYKIYENAIITNGTLHLHDWPLFRGLSLLRASRQIYDECLPFFYRNTFKLAAKDLESLSRSNRVFESHVQDLLFKWNGLVKDAAAFTLIGKLPKLKTLQLSYSEVVVMTPNWRSRNVLYQNDEDVKSFKNGNGFDSLVQIRGLEKVTVFKDWVSDLHNEKEFEAFLMKYLTLPKPIQVSIGK